MKFTSVKPFAQSRYPLAIASGLVLAAAFPAAGIAGFAWIAPALMIAVALGTPCRGFRLGYAAGLAHSLASLYWLLLIPVAGFPILGWIALSAYLALYPAVWVWLALKVSGAEGPGSGDRVQASGGDCEVPWVAAIQHIASQSRSRRVFWTFSCAAIWVALEMIQARVLTGFPWNQLGVSQHRILPLIQIASITGVPGISFLIVWTSMSLLCAAAVIISRPSLRSSWVVEILLPLAALVGAFAFGLHRLRQAPLPVRELKMTLIQPSIPQTLIWDPENDAQRFDALIQLSEQALASPTDVLIWPEAAVPGFAAWDTNLYPAITNLICKHRVWLILGSDDVGEVGVPASPDDYEYYNAAFLVSPDGQFVARYKKRSLVIFGEYIPLTRWLPFLKWFTPIQKGFTPGDRPVEFEMTISRETNPPARHESASAKEAGGPDTDDFLKPPLRVRTSPLICFEDIFAPLARECAGLNVDFLVNLTNDGWFGESAAHWQHAAAALFRAVENDLPLIRCTNNGLTCWFDSKGRLRGLFMDNDGNVYGAGFMRVSLPLPDAGAKPPPTFYHEHGDWFGWGCGGLAVLALLSLRHKGRD